MMMMSQVADALGTSLRGNDVLMTGVSKDTRDIHAGDLYVALKGERFDGHKFIADAEAAGAVGALVSDIQSAPLQSSQRSEMPQVLVEDTRIALGQLAAYWCRTWREQRAESRLIGITGSNGKTSVKEMCSKVLTDFAGEEAVLATKGNLNNDIGMPMTLLELRSQHRFAVIEMGANHVAEIDYLANIARPDVAVVNNVGPAHLQGFGSLENIAAAKAEIFNGLSDDGVAIINQDDAFAPFWKDYCSGKSTITFSTLDKAADVYAELLEDGGYRVVVKSGPGKTQQAILKLKVPGKHNVMNALAVTAICIALAIPLDDIMASLSTFENINGRLAMLDSSAGYKVIDDTYNANPLSVSAAIDVLAGMTGDTVLVLGDMAELGEQSEKMHAEIGSKAKYAGISALYATGVLSENAVKAFGSNGFYYQSQDDLIAGLINNLTADDVVLVKGSRSAAMERVVERILTHENNNKRVN
ncbi:MAG: UDP-N-acetylmuramoyl-tripeptide--D-alanyl-D-alanine ligase [Proteobacteria bacterium]|nr:UDP-N-acetylmuramoyl-tripeptide--D-alanyl-D-alanine ligase [Pseudomonadota bacterium]